MAQNLTFTALQALKPRAKAYKVTDGGGLFVEVLPTATMVWRYQFLLHGKRSKVTLGVYRSAGDPKTHVQMSLDDARDEHRRLKARVRVGENPAIIKQLEKRASRYVKDEVRTVEQLFEQWLAYGKSESTRRTLEGWWENDIKPSIGTRYINTVAPQDVEAIVARVEDRGSPASAAKVAATLRQLFKFGVEAKLASANPAAGLKPSVAARTVSHRPLEKDEIGPFLRAVSTDGAREINKLAIRLLMLTLTRKDEMRLAKWPEFDLKNSEWKIPAHRMKMGDAHTVYLSRQAVAALHRLRELGMGSEFVLPNVSSRARPIGHTTLNSVIDRLDIKGGRFVPHGFRATASSLLNERGFRADVIEKALAHESGRKTSRGIYNRATYASERAHMLQWWADYLDTLEQGHNVSPHRFGELQVAV